MVIASRDAAATPATASPKILTNRPQTSDCPCSEDLTMKPYIIGAIIIWFSCGVIGEWLLGEQRVDVPALCGGPITLWNGLNAPVD